MKPIFYTKNKLKFLNVGLFHFEYKTEYSLSRKLANKIYAQHQYIEELEKKLISKQFQKCPKCNEIVKLI